MDDNKIKILFIENDLEDVLTFRNLTADVKDIQFELTHVERLSEALLQLDKGSFDVVFLDISLPDAQGVETVGTVCAQALDMPVVVMTGLDDEVMAVQAIQQGAEDYLVKGRINAHALVRIIRYAILRHRTKAELRSLSLLDDLTGLYNRRAFFLFAGQQRKLIDRTKRGMIAFFIDLDGMKQINDTMGHNYGDMALIDTANILKETFRDSDILCRYGGDEFVALAIESYRAGDKFITSRILEKVDAANKQEKRNYELSLSVGTAYYDKKNHCSIEDLVKHADKLMYDNKRKKRQ